MLSPTPSRLAIRERLTFTFTHASPAAGSSSQTGAGSNRCGRECGKWRRKWRSALPPAEKEGMDAGPDLMTICNRSDFAAEVRFNRTFAFLIEPILPLID